MKRNNRNQKHKKNANNIIKQPEQGFDEEQLHFYNVVTGNYKYIYTPWEEEDLQPDLVLTMKLPKEYYIDRHRFLSLSSYLSSPNPQLQAAFGRAQKKIMEQMAKKKENRGDKTIKIRLQKSLYLCKPETKNLYFSNQQYQKQPFQVQCIHQKDKLLDTFTLQYNAIVYTLQRQCGFRVRSFLLYDQQIENRRIFLFLKLSPQNRVRIAAKYKIKKEIDYAQIDFSLNDPCGRDGRPLKLHSSYKECVQVVTNHKQINRYFSSKGYFLSNNEVKQEQKFTFQQQNRFLLHNEEVNYALKHYKKLRDPFLTDYEKKYVYLYNNRKINKGCNLLYHKFTQRREFFQVVKLLSEKYKFRSNDQPKMYQKFILPNRNNKGAGYFQRIRGIMLYKPQNIGPDGQTDLFLKMEKTKLAYLQLKNTFKINFLQKIGFDVFAFGSQFQKYGEERNKKLQGGIDGQNLADRWPVYSIFMNLSIVRNYCGDIVGHQISFKIYMLYFFLVSIAPYTFNYILEQTFKSAVYLGSNFTKLAYFSLFFKSYISFWTFYQDEFINDYQDQVPSKIFLNSYRGPYTRNLLTDQLNQYQKQKGLLPAIKNLVCVFIILTLLIICGAIFHGCRMFLLSIYDNYFKLKISSISFPHFITYLLFFILMDVLRYFATEHIIDLLVKIKNPPSDQDARSEAHNFKFFYLLGIQLIAPIFFYIIQPFQDTDCYSKNCNKQIQYYIYSRYLIILFTVLFKFIKLLVIKYSIGLKNLIMQQNEVQQVSFQGRLSKLLVDSLQEIDKTQHFSSNSLELIYIIGYALYSLLLPKVVLISAGNLMIQIFNVRSNLLQKQRRPINRSQSILRLSNQLNIIFFVSVLTNSWMMFFSFQTLQLNFPQLITIFIPNITSDSVFFFKLVCTIILSLFLLVLGIIAGEITKVIADKWLISTHMFYSERKNNKFREYIANQFTDKVSLLPVEDRMPIKSIFRTWNPKQMPHETLQKMLIKYKQVFEGVLNDEQEIYSERKLISNKNY